jgi:bifunctional UDP-N-acetylglucosamine pyrophosphorylase/glucosamine-1-phosphate N-acetyltransferase
MSERLAIAILAAGKGTRLKSALAKVLHQIGGKALLRHVIDTALHVAAPQDIFVIVGHQAHAVQDAVAETGVRFVLQTEQLGTGHAIQVLRNVWAEQRMSSDKYDELIVLSGDVPLLTLDTLKLLKAFHDEQHAAMTILTAVPADPTGYGRVLRASAGSADVTAIVEQKALKPEQLAAPEINSGIYCFQTAALFAHLDALQTNNAHGELYLTDIAALLVADGEKVVAVAAPRFDEVLGANTIAEMMQLDSTLRMDKAKALMAAGVTIFAPETCVIDADVTVGADTVLEPFVQLRGKTVVGSNCVIRSYSVIQDSTLAGGVLIKNSCVLDGAELETGAQVGPFAHLRPKSHIGQNAHVGNFVETKASTLHAGVKAGHLSYLGDAEIGAGTNVGAGTITCNYDGVKKHRTTIGEGAFIGSDSALVAPVTIGDGAYVAAGSVITEDVPADALALGRARQVTKDGWAKEKRTEQGKT